jgi:hypothetical protein
MQRFCGGLLAIGISLAITSRGASAQVPQPNPNAKACAYLPLVELEAHFGAKPATVLGIDQPTRNTCSANFPTATRAAVVESHPPNAADQAMAAAQRLQFLKAAFKNADMKDYGSVGCIRATIDMGEPVQETTCFLAKAQYLALTVRHVDAARVDFDAVKTLLEKTAARRK